MMTRDQKQLIGNRYLLQKQLGAGGMGTVHRALDQQTGEYVAVKLLKPDVVADDPRLLERFIREADALRQLNHPNIVKVLSTFHEGDRHSIIMELVEGGSLNDLLKTQPKLPIGRVLSLAIELADALTRAHHLKIIHRDLKPANVLVAADGTPRLTDFGVAHIGTKERVTQQGVIIGTPDYMSPEAINGEPSDERSDIWAFGVMLYEMLAGERPFRGETITPLVTSIITQPAPDLEALRPDAPIALIDLIYRMLEKDHSARISSVRLIGAELEAIIQGHGTTVTPRSRESRPTEPADSGRFDAKTPSTSPTKHNLPAQATPFVGRESELVEIARILRSSDVRLLTILAPGGMGKTRLSIESGQRQLSNFYNGVYFVPLAPLTSSANIVSAVADALGFTFAGDSRDPRQQVLDYLREKELLLVMDNFEHVLEGAPLVSDILQVAPGVKVLATSRERLNLTGETIFTLEGMDFPDWETPADAMKYSAVQLFLQSARRTQPGFELTTDNLPFVARICRLVQGMPLGIVLAAAWVEMLNPQEIADEIGKSLDFLETEMRDVPERHRSIRAVFDYSWNLLSETERDAFIKLAIFRGGFERDAAQKIADASLRTLTSLVNKSLLRREPNSGRYSIHMLLRQYAEERFSEKYGSGEELHRKHALYFGEWIEKLAPVFNTKKEREAAEAVDVEHENMRMAWEWALQYGCWETVTRMVDGTMEYFLSRSLMMEGDKVFGWLAETLQQQGLDKDPLYWRARVRQATFIGRMGNYDKAWQSSNAAYDYFVGIGDKTETVIALNGMSYARMMVGAYEDAKKFAREAADLAKQLEDQTWSLMSLANLGYAEFLQGNYEEARNIYETVDLCECTDELAPSARAYGLNNLGEIRLWMGEIEAAGELFQQAYDIFKSLKQRRGMAFTINNMGGVLTWLSRFDEARKLFEEAYALNKEIGDRAGIGHSLSALGNMEHFTGNYEGAIKRYEESLAIRRSTGDQRGIADSLTDIADVHLMKNNSDEAYKYYEESLAIRRAIGDQAGEVHALSWMAMIKSTSGGDLQEVHKMLDQALQMAEKIGVPFGIAQVHCTLAGLALDEHDYDKATTHLRRALEVASGAKVDGISMYAIAGFSKLLEVKGDKVRAFEIASFVKNAPHSYITFLTDRIVDHVIERVSKELSPEALTAARTRSQTLKLEEIAAGIMAMYAK